MASPQGRLQTHLAQYTGADMMDEDELAKPQALLVAHPVRDVRLTMNQIDKMFDQSSRTGADMSILFASGTKLAPAASMKTHCLSWSSMLLTSSAQPTQR
ncbi:hypothetical protein EON66_08820 [archaeon]|nr:MAG: hypothetical protein EON66_08820 [archaeon]